jgi:hypothetical protein
LVSGLLGYRSGVGGFLEVAHHCSCLCITPLPGIYDVAGVTVLSLFARVKDPLPDRRPTLVGRLPRGTARVDGCLLALSAAVVPRAGLMAYAGCRAFSLLHNRLLDEGMRLAVQVACLRCRGRGMARSSVAAAMSFWLARGGVCRSSTLKSVLMRSRACFSSSRTFTTCRGFSSDGGAQESHMSILFRELGFELTRLR